MKANIYIHLRISTTILFSYLTKTELAYRKNGATSNDIVPFKAQSNESVP